MNRKTIHILVASIYLLVMGFGILIGQNIKPEQKSDSQEPATGDYKILNSGETFTIEEELAKFLVENIDTAGLKSEQSKK